MIISFYDREFKGLQNNASLVVDNKSYSLIRRGVELDELKCVCEPFIEDIQPTFLVVKNDRGNYVYGCLAGIPELTAERKTVITGTDLKSMLKSDVVLDLTTSFANVDALLTYGFNQWKTQVNQSSFNCELVFETYSVNPFPVEFDYLKHEEKGVYDLWEDIFAPYLKYYGLYMACELDLVNKKVVFKIGKSMRIDMNIRLWENGIYDYGKWVANVNETQGYVHRTDTDTLIASANKWILKSDNTVTTNTAQRDIYPIKRKIKVVDASDSTEQVAKMKEADIEALEMLCESMFNENITIAITNADFETKFNIYVKRGGGLYKSLPCGELHYDASGLKSVQIGYRFTGLQFLL